MGEMNFDEVKPRRHGPPRAENEFLLQFIHVLFRDFPRVAVHHGAGQGGRRERSKPGYGLGSLSARMVKLCSHAAARVMNGAAELFQTGEKAIVPDAYLGGESRSFG